MKRALLSLLLLALLIVPAFAAGTVSAEPKADAPEVTIIYFWGDG